MVCVVTVVYKPVAFQDSAAVTFNHTWPGFMIIIPSGVAAFLALTDGIKNQELMFASAIYKCKDATMVGFWEKSQKSDQMPYFGQNLVGF